MSYLLMLALTVISAVWLTRPWWRTSLPAAQRRRAANVAAYHTRSTELQADLAAGLIAAEEVAALQHELDARVVGDVGLDNGVTEIASPRRLLPVLLIALLFAGFGALWYQQAGSWRAAAQIAGLPDAGTPASAPEVAKMVAQLAARLADQPDDAEGWAMLGRSYFVAQRYEESAKAYASANQHSDGQKPEWLTNEGEALTMARDHDLIGKPTQLFTAALALAPDYGKALWYGGLAATQAKDYVLARQRFESLSQQSLPEEIRAVLVARLDELNLLQGLPAAASKPTDEPATKSPAGAAEAVRLTLNIHLRSDLASKLPADAVLFVFAKAAGGPPMPLAVQRIPGASLPITVTLDDSMAMTPTMKLSQFDRYVVTARLSKSGGAQAQPGDLQTVREVTRADAGKPLELEIDQAVGP